MFLRDQVYGTSISYSSTKKPSSPGPTDRAPDEMYEISPHLFTPVNAGLENKVKQPSNGELALKIKKEILSSDEISDEENVGLEKKVKQASNSELALKIKKEKLSSDEISSDEENL